MNALTGIAALIGLALRRDRFKLAAYVLGPAVLMAGMVGMWSAEAPQAHAEEAQLFAGTPPCASSVWPPAPASAPSS